MAKKYINIKEGIFEWLDYFATMLALIIHFWKETFDIFWEIQIILDEKNTINWL